jgi:hypothetical protein
MSQPSNGAPNLLDPFGMVGILKQTRDANLEALSKFMIDLVNSDAYAQATGTMLAQSLAASQPARQALEQSMTHTLEALNMPSRAEVTSIAERLVNVEMRLDDLDAKISANHKVLPALVREALAPALRQVVQEAVRETVQEAVRETVQEAVREALRKTPPALRSPRALRDLETRLTALDTRLAALQEAIIPPAGEKAQEDPS